MYPWAHFCDEPELLGVRMPESLGNWVDIWREKNSNGYFFAKITPLKTKSEYPPFM